MKSAITSSPLRVAIIGAGQVADKVHASYYCTRDDLELVAVCDSRLSQAQALAEKYGSASVWDDPEKNAKRCTTGHRQHLFAKSFSL
ncbi:oxidoreductase [Salmonella bongori]|nr:oxidoreductase [Salmonella bongori]